MKKIYYTEEQERKIKKLLCFLVRKTNSREMLWKDNTGHPFLEQIYRSKYNNINIILFFPDGNYYNKQENGFGLKINGEKVISFDQRFNWKENEVGFKLNELINCAWQKRERIYR